VSLVDTRSPSVEGRTEATVGGADRGHEQRPASAWRTRGPVGVDARFWLGVLSVGGDGHPDLDPSQQDIENRHRFDNVHDDPGRLPATLLAHYGRVLEVFRPAEMVDINAKWLNGASRPVSAWVTSFWLLAPPAVVGSVLLRRSRRFQWSLVAPMVIVLMVVAVAFGDPRYHTLADLGLVLPAAVIVGQLVRRVVARCSAATESVPA
jgi:hypothetical protein